MSVEVDDVATVTSLDRRTTRAIDPGKVEAARAVLVSPTEAAEVAELFRLLGDPNRARLLYALLEAGELCVCDLAATIDASETSVSHALRLLRSAGVVEHRRAGRRMYYRLADAHVRMVLDISREHLRHESTQGSR